MDYISKALTGDWTWQHTVFEYELHDPAPQWLAEFAPTWAQLPGGVFIAKGVTDAAKMPGRTYDPVGVANELIAAGTSFDPQDREALLRFVNRWGLLGLVAPDDAVQQWDSVFFTQDHLTRLGYLVRRLEALKNQNWASKDLLSVAQLQAELPGMPSRVTPVVRQRAQWQAWAHQLNQALQGCPIQPLLVPIAGSDVPGLRPAWRPRRLADVLLVTLWQHATEGDRIPRRCGTCHGMFFVSVTN